MSSYEVKKYDIPADLHPALPPAKTAVYPLPTHQIPLYTHLFKTANCRIPFTRFLIKTLMYYGVHISQCAPLGVAKIIHFEITCRALGEVPDLTVFRKFFHITKAGDWYTFERRRSIALSCFTSALTGLKNWKDNFFYVDDRCIPTEMRWRPNNATSIKDTEPPTHLVNNSLFLNIAAASHPVRKYPEHILVVGWISRKWPHDHKWPSISKDEQEVDLADVLQMDNFMDLTFEELDMDSSDQPFLNRNTTAFQNIRPILATGEPSKSITPPQTLSPIPDPVLNPDPSLKRKKSTAGGSKKKTRPTTGGATSSSKFPTTSHTSSLENLSSHLQGEDINRESLARQIRRQKTPESHDPITFLNDTPTKTTSRHDPEKSPEHTPSPPLLLS
ncbi:hypothetical protein QVD17_02415 [Tagetes erecta]|uniref:Transposase (putative) gypsy type domain-containing protein n=1 Tax=Tagetes erecta TaxID=13708 RepID=A0AAD8L964_TARER|nr:hypothetical protein QVD17_02415 [Tagetes erecta]